MYPEQHRDGEHRKPHGYDEIGGADVLAELFGETKPGLLGLHERDETDDEREQAADVPEPPTETRNEADALPRREIGQERVVEHLAGLERDVGHHEHNEREHYLPRQRAVQHGSCDDADNHGNDEKQFAVAAAVRDRTEHG